MPKFKRMSIPTTRDYAGTAYVNLSIALETTDLDDRQLRLSMAVADLASAGETAWASLAHEVYQGRAYVSFLAPVVARLKEKYNLQ